MNNLFLVLVLFMQTVSSLQNPFVVVGTNFQTADLVTAQPSGTVCSNIVIVSSNQINANCPVDTTSVTVVHRHHVSMAWKAATIPVGAPPVTNYYVMKGAAASGPFTRIATLNQQSFSYVDLAVNPNQSYCYTVQAVNSNGPSANATPVCVTIP